MTSKHWCPNSGTYASFTERVIHDDQHAKCGQCGRLLKLRKNHVIPHHRPPAVPTPVTPPSKPKGVEGESPGARGDQPPLAVVRADHRQPLWNQRNGLGPNATQDIYSDSMMFDVSADGRYRDAEGVQRVGDVERLYAVCALGHRWRVRGAVQVTSVDVGPEEKGAL